MKLEYRKLAEIKPYWRNPRKNDRTLGPLKKSMVRFGVKAPLQIDENGVIITGHARYRAAMELGLEEVPVIVVKDLNSEQVKEYRIADNKVAEKSEWDYEQLGVEFEELNDPKIMLELGFTPNEVLNLIDIDLDSKLDGLSAEEKPLDIDLSTGTVDTEFGMPEESDVEKPETQSDSTEESEIELVCPECLEVQVVQKQEILDKGGLENGEQDNA